MDAAQQEMFLSCRDLMRLPRNQLTKLSILFTLFSVSHLDDARQHQNFSWQLEELNSRRIFALFGFSLLKYSPSMKCLVLTLDKTEIC